jgi:hypothetical protein
VPVALPLTLLLVAALAVAVESAPDDYALIKIPAARIQELARVGALDERTHMLTASVDQRICATIDLLGPSNIDSEGNKVFVIGTEDQPRACREGEGVVTFIHSGHPLFVKLPLRRGETQLLENLAPEAPRPGQSRGFLRVTVSVPGEGLIRGSGSLMGDGPGAGASLVIVPDYEPQPLSITRVLPYLFAIEASGETPLVLPEGRYLVTYNNTEFRVVGADQTIQIGAGQSLTFPAVAFTLERGEDLRFDLTVTRESLAPTPPRITAPVAGDAGLR